MTQNYQDHPAYKEGLSDGIVRGKQAGFEMGVFKGYEDGKIDRDLELAGLEPENEPSKLWRSKK